jgi:predicted nucleotide-binding protein
MAHGPRRWKLESNLEQLQRLQKEGSDFTFSNFSDGTRGQPYGGQDTPAWLTWKTRVWNTIKVMLEENSAPVVLLTRAMEIHTAGNLEDSFLKRKELILSALQKGIEVARDDVFGETRRPKSVSASGALSNRIFVVHGHDHATKTELEVFLAGLGLEPVILHRQPDQGRTLIEKFEHHSDVGFAFILLTPDDVAYNADEDTLADDRRSKEFRARPNVTFEFGYFVGRLGRHRVCCLIKGDVAKPSDIDGLVYKSITGSIEGIGYSIIKELKAAGYTINI